MHAYLPAIGFTSKNKEELENIISTTIKAPTYNEVSISDDNTMFVEHRLKICEDVYFVIRGSYNEEDEFIVDYYFPTLYGNSESSYGKVEIIKQTDKESYQCMCDEIRLGVNLIFTLQNMGDYLRVSSMLSNPNTGLIRLGGLSLEGIIILPILKTEKELQKVEARTRESLIEAAREGDQMAMEDLTIDDMDMYDMISRRIPDEDVLTIVESSFMPYGIENDKYTIIGDILDIKERINTFTLEELYILTVSACEVEFEICINKKNLFGEPEIGRRFKGNVWLSGTVDFE